MISCAGRCGGGDNSDRTFKFRSQIQIADGQQPLRSVRVIFGGDACCRFTVTNLTVSGKRAVHEPRWWFSLQKKISFLKKTNINKTWLISIKQPRKTHSQSGGTRFEINVTVVNAKPFYFGTNSDALGQREVGFTRAVETHFVTCTRGEGLV